MENVKEYERIKYAEQMIKEYLPDFDLTLRHMKRTWGTCFYRKQKINLNFRLIIEANDKFFRHVLFHEISHGLAYPNMGHCTYDFKKWCNYFNALPDRCISFNSDKVLSCKEL